MIPRPRVRPLPPSPIPVIAGMLLGAVLGAGIYWLAVVRPAAQVAERESLERATQRAIDARERGLEVLERLHRVGSP